MRTREYPTTFRQCSECLERAESWDPHVCAERLINIPYTCPNGHEWIVKLPAITDFARRQAHQLMSRKQIDDLQRSVMDDPAVVARRLEELRRLAAQTLADTQDRIEAEAAAEAARAAAEAEEALTEALQEEQLLHDAPELPVE